MISKETGRATEDVSQIPGVTEQQFFLFVKKRFPTARIIYEPEEFSLDGNKSTSPDFKITKNNGSIIYVEITANPRPTIINKNGVDSTPGASKDLKGKQKVIMSGTGRRYVVLYRENLSNIQRYHPDEVDFFSASKIRNNKV